eukprot:SAG31_NODE_645_length_13244_cov_11.768903_2_plen_60_part_00
MRGDDNTNIGTIQPCTHGGPRSQTEIKAEDTRRGDGDELRIDRDFGSRPRGREFESRYT